jgi:hypothetical protein
MSHQDSDKAHSDGSHASEQHSCYCAAGCGKLLQESITGNRWTKWGYMCSDCYFEKVGEIFEADLSRRAKAPK